MGDSTGVMKKGVREWLFDVLEKTGEKNNQPDRVDGSESFGIDFGKETWKNAISRYKIMIKNKRRLTLRKATLHREKMHMPFSYPQA